MKLMSDLTSDALVMILSPAFKDIYVWLGHCFKAVTLPYLLLILSLLDLNMFVIFLV
jgi:hypothetical protein